PDSDVREVLDVLRKYTASHPAAEADSYRQNSASIRIRIVDPGFAGIGRSTRDDRIWKILSQLPERIQSQITVLLLLTPEEVETSFANMDFENPLPSRL